MKHLLR